MPPVFTITFPCFEAIETYCNNIRKWVDRSEMYTFLYWFRLNNLRPPYNDLEFTFAKSSLNDAPTRYHMIYDDMKVIESYET